MWLSRLSIFSEDNPYYNPYGEFNIYTDDIRMPNCTAYAYLRMQEEMELEHRDAYLIKSDGGFGHAKTWFNTTPLAKGYELKEGAIAVFDGNCGHVAVVEQKIDDTHAIISQSQYDANKSLRNYKYWEKREIELVVGKATLSGIGALIGYIYPPINDIRVSRNMNEQIEITDSMVNVRIAPEAEVFSKGLYCPMGVFNVRSKEEVNGYTWYELEPNHWVREGDWLTYYPAQNANDDLVKENEVLKAENKALKERLTEINNLSKV